MGRVTEALAKDAAATSAENGRPAVLLAMARQRGAAAAELRSVADAFADGGLAAEAAADQALMIKGKCNAECAHLSRQLFVVEEVIDPTTGQAIGLDIDVAPRLPAPDDSATPEQMALFVSIQSALTVINVACQRIHDRGKGWFTRKKKTKQPQTSHASRLLDLYVRKLGAIARLGLQEPHVQLAQLALDGLKAEFVAHEAGRIKNTYVRSLGRASAVCVAFLLTVYVLVDADYISMPFGKVHKVFLVAAIGACLGTWLSFSIRRVNLSFGDLAVLEEDLLDPSVRVIFVAGLTFTACLLFWTKAINIEIGQLKTAELAGATALLVGLFCGIAERALATAISGRAATFVRGSVSTMG
jgi:hypothetical protein